MSMTTLFESPHHRNLLLESSAPGDAAVQTNQHLIIHERGGFLLDPGGHKVYPPTLTQTMSQLGGGKLDGLFLSHQDPDVIGALNGWLMSSDALAYVSSIWLRFIPHLGLDRLVVSRLRGIPDAGAFIDLRGVKLMAVPAHFLHSEGNLQLYDPVSKILYSGDLGASIGAGFGEVLDFDAHVPKMVDFHRRMMSSNQTLRRWAAMIRGLDLELIAPQHGGFFRGKAMVERFVSWCEGLQVGTDLMGEGYRLPTKTLSDFK